MFIEITVKVKGRKSLGPAKIKYFYPDIPGGVKLDREIDGFTSWNIENLEIVEQRILTERDLQRSN